MTATASDKTGPTEMEAPPGVSPCPEWGSSGAHRSGRARAAGQGPGRLSIQRGRPSSKQPLPTRRALQEDGTASGWGSQLPRAGSDTTPCLSALHGGCDKLRAMGRTKCSRPLWGHLVQATPPPQPLASENLRLGPAPHLPRPQPPPPLLSPGSARGRQALSQARVGPVQLTWQGKKEGWGGQRPASYLQPAQ